MPAQLTVAHIEATQAIQSVEHAVPLMAGRDLYVRVFLNIGGVTPTADTAAVSGKLTVVTATGGTLTLDSLFDEYEPRVRGAQNGNLDAQRADPTSGLVFRLPADSVATGQVTLNLAAVSDRDGSRALSCANCDSLTRTVTVQEAAPAIRLTVIGVGYTVGGRTFEPRAIDFAMVPSWLRRAYPVGPITYDFRTMPYPDANLRPDNGLDCRAVNTFLAQVRATDIAGGLDPRTRYYGMVYEGDADGPQQFMRGCAVTIPDVPDPSATASGPTGASKWGWDDSGSYGGWYTAHEVGHTLGRRHVGGTCRETGTDPSFPFPGGLISNDASTFVGFDPGDSVEGTNLGPLAFPGRATAGIATARLGHDVMSYCPWQWISSYTYGNVRDRLLAEARLEGTPTSGPNVAGAAPPANQATAGAAPGDGQTRARAIAAPAPARAAAPGPATSATGEGVRVAAETGRYLHLVVRVEDGWTKAKLVSVTPTRYPATSGYSATRGAAPADTPVVETLAADGRVLARLPVAVQAFTEEDDDTVKPRPAGLVNLSVPIDDTVAGLRLVYAGQTLAESMASPERPTLSTAPVTRSAAPIPAPAAEPRVAQPAPAPSPTPRSVEPPRSVERPRPLAQDEPFVVSWRTAYGGSKTLTYTVQLSSDGQTWQTVATGLTQPRVEIKPSALGRALREDRAAGRPLKYKVIATDGYRSTEIQGDVR